MAIRITTKSIDDARIPSCSKVVGSDPAYGGRLVKHLMRSLLLVFVAIYSLGCGTRTGLKDGNPGAQWLSLTSGERSNIISAYVQGYEDGMYRACSSAAKLGDEDEAFFIQNGIRHQKISYERCRAGVAEYTNYGLQNGKGADCQIYADTLTEFYSRHAEYRDIPFSYLMEFLTSREHKSAQDLFVMAQTGAIRTKW